MKSSYKYIYVLSSGGPLQRKVQEIWESEKLLNGSWNVQEFNEILGIYMHKILVEIFSLEFIIFIRKKCL